MLLQQEADTVDSNLQSRPDAVRRLSFSAPCPVTWPGAGTVTTDNESNGVSRAFFAPAPISGRDGRRPQSGGA
jgi:hypothetical protein